MAREVGSRLAEIIVNKRLAVAIFVAFKTTQFSKSWKIQVRIDFIPKCKICIGLGVNSDFHRPGSNFNAKF